MEGQATLTGRLSYQIPVPGRPSLASDDTEQVVKQRKCGRRACSMLLEL